MYLRRWDGSLTLTKQAPCTDSGCPAGSSQLPNRLPPRDIGIGEGYSGYRPGSLVDDSSVVLPLVTGIDQGGPSTAGVSTCLVMGDVVHMDDLGQYFYKLK